MTNVNITEDTYQVTVTEGVTQVVTVKAPGPQGPSFPDGDLGDVTSSNTGTTVTVNAGAIDNANIASNAAIDLTKLATGALPTAITVTSANISDLSIVNADINASAAIAGTKISPDFGSQDIDTTGKIKITGSGGNGSSLNITNAHDSAFLNFTDNTNNSDFNITYAGTGGAEIKLQHDGTVQLAYGGALKLKTQSNGVAVTGSISVTGSVDGRDLQTDGTKLDGIEANAKDDQTAAEIKTLLDSNGIVNSNVDANAAIAGSKINPSFTSNIVTTGNQLQFSNNSGGRILFSDSNNNPDYRVESSQGKFQIDQNNALNPIFKINSDGHVDINNNLDCGAGVDITGDLTVSGNMTVSGTTTTIDTTTLTVEDKNIELGKVSTPTDTTADGGGLTLKGATDKTFQWLDATDSWTSSEHIALPDNKKLQLGASQDLQIYHDGTDNYINAVNGKLRLVSGDQIRGRANGYVFNNPGDTENIFKALENSSVELYFDNSKKFETTSLGATVTGKLGIGTTSPDHDLHIFANHANAAELRIENTEGFIRFRTNNNVGSYGAQEHIFKNSGLTTEYMRIDTSGNLKIPADNKKLLIGASQDFEFYHDSNNSIIANNTGSTYIKGLGGSGNTIWLQPQNNESSAKFNPNGDVELFYDNSLKFATTSYGVLAHEALKAEGDFIAIDNSGDASYRLTRNGSALFTIRNNNVHNVHVNTQNSATLSFGVSTQNIHAGSIEQQLRIKGDTRHVQIPNDTSKLQIGASQDLEIYHNGNHSKIVDTGTGNLYLESDAGNIYLRVSDNEQGVTILQDGAVELYFDNVKQLQTTANGIGFINNCTFSDNKRIQMGASNDLSIYHDTANSILQNATGALLLQSNDLKLGNYNLTDVYFRGQADNAAELYFDNTKKFQTTADGVRVTNIPNNRGLDLNGVGNNTCIRFMSTGSSPSHTYRLNLHTSTSGLFNAPCLAFDKTATNGDFSDHIAAISDDGFHLDDNKKLHLGGKVASGDLKIYHDANNSVIDNDTGDLYITSANSILIQGANNENVIKYNANGAVELYHDDSKKLETSSDGVIFTGAARFVGNETGFLTAKAHPTLYRTASTSGSYPFNNFGHLVIQSRNDGANRDIIFATGTSSSKLNRITSDGHLDVFGDNQKLRLGASQDLELFHDGGTSRIVSDSHALMLNTTVFVVKNAAFNEDMLSATSDNAVNLYFDGSKKFETTSTGATVTTTSAANSIKNITTSTSAPSGGSDGDLWFTYIA